MRVESQVASVENALTVPRSRLLPVDWLRGLVMVLMAVDHASEAFNGRHLLTDSASLYQPGTPLPAAQFFTRWMTHICAPTFLFLAGFVLYFSVERRRRDGQSEGRITRFIVTRGIVITLLDPLWMGFVYARRGQAAFLVLYAIGMSFVALAFLRRLPPLLLGGVGLVLCFACEPLTGIFGGAGGPAGALTHLLLVPGEFGRFFVAYPLLPWLAMMLLGWAAADLAHREPERFPHRLVLAGVISLAIFAVARGLNGFGNAGLLRDDGSFVQWLHTSKFPPSLSYTASELGLAWVLLAAFWGGQIPRWAAGILTPLGQAALFFYLLHIHVLVAAARFLGLRHRAGLGASYLSAAVVIGVFVPACQAYRRYKLTHPHSWAQYI